MEKNFEPAPQDNEALSTGIKTPEELKAKLQGIDAHISITRKGFKQDVERVVMNAERLISLIRSRRETQESIDFLSSPSSPMPEGVPEEP